MVWLALCAFNSAHIHTIFHSLPFSAQSPNPVELQLTLTGFLEKKAPAFVAELWRMLASAQASPSGIPSTLLESRKFELVEQQRRAADAAAAAAAAVFGQAAGAATAAAAASVAAGALAPAPHLQEAVTAT